MAPEDQQRFLERMEGGRRDFLKKLMLTAYVAPFVASFGMKGLGMGEAMAQSNACSNLSISNTGLADLIITKTGSPNPASPGENITYSIRVENCGPASAANVNVTDNVPVGTTFVSASQTSGPTFTLMSAPSVGGTGPVIFTLGTFNSGDVATFQLVVNVTA
jgi:uncharacterized repeat protein (TIGR01451 family)